jgi:hypothetical protein
VSQSSLRVRARAQVAVVTHVPDAEPFSSPSNALWKSDHRGRRQRQYICATVQCMNEPRRDFGHYKNETIKSKQESASLLSCRLSKTRVHNQGTKTSYKTRRQLQNRRGLQNRCWDCRRQRNTKQLTNGKTRHARRVESPDATGISRTRERPGQECRFKSKAEQNPAHHHTMSSTLVLALVLALG